LVAFLWGTSYYIDLLWCLLVFRNWLGEVLGWEVWWWWRREVLLREVLWWEVRRWWRRKVLWLEVLRRWWGKVFLREAVSREAFSREALWRIYFTWESALGFSM
jgi:hypothetical protein